MNFNNRINRLSSTLTLLSKGQELSTPSLVKRFITLLTNNLKSQLAYCTFGCLIKLATF